MRVVRLQPEHLREASEGLCAPTLGLQRLSVLMRVGGVPRAVLHSLLECAAGLLGIVDNPESAVSEYVYLFCSGCAGMVVATRTIAGAGARRDRVARALLSVSDYFLRLFKKPRIY